LRCGAGFAARLEDAAGKDAAPIWPAAEAVEVGHPRWECDLDGPVTKALVKLLRRLLPGLVRIEDEIDIVKSLQRLRHLAGDAGPEQGDGPEAPPDGSEPVEGTFGHDHRLAPRAREAEEFVARALAVAGTWEDPAIRVAGTVVDEFARLVADAASPIDDIRATAEYRRHACGVLARRALSWALEERKASAEL